MIQRERERSTTHPLGGLLCDVMGFGKTVTALSNILDGRPKDKDDQQAPTLIVAPTGLISHWYVYQECEQGRSFWS